MTMDKDLEQHLQQAIDRSMQWAIDGWPVTFGDREVVVSSLDQAQNLSENAVHRQVALGYWDNVCRLGHESAAWGRKAMKHLADDDLEAAEAAVYYAWYLERPLAQQTMTWEPVHEHLKRALRTSGKEWGPQVGGRY
jgi:hypothetical protein